MPFIGAPFSQITPHGQIGYVPQPGYVLQQGSSLPMPIATHGQSYTTSRPPTLVPPRNYRPQPATAKSPPSSMVVPNMSHPAIKKFDPNVKTRFFSEEELRESFLGAIKQFGVKGLWFGGSTEKLTQHPSPYLKERFPHKRLSFVCNSCSKKERAVPSTVYGCCGIFIQAAININTPGVPIHLVVQKFCFPVTSKHALVSRETRDELDHQPLQYESQLSQEQTKILKALGGSRVEVYFVRNIMKTMFPKLDMDEDLLWRVASKGRAEIVGHNDEDMVKFFEKGIEMRNNGGSFQAESSGSQLYAWSGQTPLEKKLAQVYGDDIYFLDTTHKACQFILKTGPLKSVDCFGMNAPIGIFQVPQEDGLSVHDRLTHLGLNAANTSARTDAARAWDYPIVECRKQSHTHDPHHLQQTAQEICDSSYDSLEFPSDVNDALYSFVMNVNGLEKHLEGMVTKSKGTGVEKWVASFCAEQREEMLCLYQRVVAMCT